MTHTADIMAASPQAFPFQRETLVRCIDACLECAQVCTACADACLAEEDVEELVRCIALNLNCGDVCETTARMLSRPTAFDELLVRTLLESCALACKTCGEECARHAEHHEHCRICAESCRACEQSCRDLLAVA